MSRRATTLVLVVLLLGSAMAKLKVYNLGTKGVNLSRSPIHLEDGELTQAQNAELYLDQGELAIRKRLGIAKFTDIGDSPVLSIGPVTLPDPFPAEPVPAFATLPFAIIEPPPYNPLYITPLYYGTPTWHYAGSITDQQNTVVNLRGPAFVPGVARVDGGTRWTYFQAAGVGTLTAGAIYRLSQDMTALELVAAPPSDPSFPAGVTAWSNQSYSQLTQIGGDRNYLLGSTQVDGDDGDVYEQLWAFSLVAGTYTYLGSAPERMSDNVAKGYPYQDLNVSQAVVFNGQVIYAHKWFRAAPILAVSQMQMRLRSCPVGGGAWTALYTVDHTVQDGSSGNVVANDTTVFFSYDMPAGTPNYYNLKSNDGTTWSAFTDPSAGVDAQTLWADANHAGVVIAIDTGLSPGLYVSTDNGTTWTETDHGDCSYGVFRAGDYYWTLPPGATGNLWYAPVSAPTVFTDSEIELTSWLGGTGAWVVHDLVTPVAY